MKHLTITLCKLKKLLGSQTAFPLREPNQHSNFQALKNNMPHPIQPALSLETVLILKNSLLMKALLITLDLQSQARIAKLIQTKHNRPLNHLAKQMNIHNSCMNSFQETQRGESAVVMRTYMHRQDCQREWHQKGSVSSLTLFQKIIV